MDLRIVWSLQAFLFLNVIFFLDDGREMIMFVTLV